MGANPMDFSEKTPHYGKQCDVAAKNKSGLWTALTSHPETAKQRGSVA